MRKDSRLLAGISLGDLRRKNSVRCPHDSPLEHNQVIKRFYERLVLADRAKGSERDHAF